MPFIITIKFHCKLLKQVLRNYFRNYFRNDLHFRNLSGQTAVEFMLMIAIMVVFLRAGLDAASPYITEWLLTVHKNIGDNVRYGVPEGDLFDHFLVF